MFTIRLLAVIVISFSGFITHCSEEKKFHRYEQDQKGSLTAPRAPRSRPQIAPTYGFEFEFLGPVVTVPLPQMRVASVIVEGKQPDARQLAIISMYRGTSQPDLD